ncbi:hypothetical protein N0V83_003429 [Neocucurbitaria cava]|uniref:Aminoglycoside phosphotransferase domain-containing protein n=1 Tax=Neocucurbitaria cava TaxID=798079 RepID=A0A9W9CNN2_9PLEO|nr:hypothetical protein N0V83_003429 [Neocucurbitaria cava]
MSQRHVRFNVQELARHAADTVGARACTRIEKYPEGMYNKSMLLTMDNGSQVVAKVPNPNAGLPHFTTASEVATMEFARTILRTPVPKALAWSSQAQKNPVGAEYIIMEKAPGIELERVWPKMVAEDRFAVVKAIAGFQKAWTEVSFTKYGSLYFSEDLGKLQTDKEPLYIDANGAQITNHRFAVGPCTGREWVDSGRAAINFDRGPHQSLEEFHAAIGHREISCVKQLPELPKSPITLCGPGTYRPTREKKLKALHCYLELIQFLLPADRTISSPHLWHSDLHVANIFVDPSNPTKILSIIDWQSTELSPLYFQARQPQIIDYDGGPSPTGSGGLLDRPQLPKDFKTLDPSSPARRRAQALFLQQSLCVLYNTMTHRKIPLLYAALQFQQTPSYLLLLLARNLLIDGEATYLAHVADLESSWDDFFSVATTGKNSPPYPFAFSAQEHREFDADAEGAAHGMEVMREVKESLGELFPEQGLVRSELYNEALHALAQVKEQVIDAFARDGGEREKWEKGWPFGT